MARILFMGTPEYARVILDGLLTRSDLTIRVVTKADTPQGRHMRLTPSPVAQRASERGLMVDKPDRLVAYKDAWLKWAPDLIITAAYGKILRPWVLGLPRHGAFNLHASLLPRWRGPNPIAWAIRAGDAMTGVTLMRMDQGVDTGDIVAQRSVAITNEMTMGKLTNLLAEQARDLLLEYLDRLLSGQVKETAQDDSQATYAGKFAPEDSRINWNQPATSIDRLIRSMSPEPGAYTMCQGIRVKILECAYDKGTQPIATAELAGNHWQIGTAEGVVIVKRVKPAGRKEMTPGDFQRGLHVVGKVVCQ
ncbi:methionyl-tRNA formyltransferase [Sulfobacillus thermosulfidooxidans]|uniref:methionyl-tRNA formyltransferase n=1 Tax=Sulfobacillus thermosulfidooxidans TaxID=28034 RepID=UPI00031FE31B|nr:methionyl-tRNA formyltransferase [Sulfobacillus thermosulfidooxidans]